jgi:hypothetical protein
MVALISVAPSLVVMLVAAFFGLKAVAASAFVTLPLQGFVALHFIRSRIGFRWSELVRAVRKSAVVAACTVLFMGAAMAANDFRLSISTGGFLSAALAGLGGWWLGLLITRHPLLTELNASLARLGVVVRCGVLPATRWKTGSPDQAIAKGRVNGRVPS